MAFKLVQHHKLQSEIRARTRRASEYESKVARQMLSTLFIPHWLRVGLAALARVRCALECEALPSLLYLSFWENT